MNLEGTPYSSHTAGTLVATRKTNDTTLSDQVRQSLDDYFDALDGTQANELYQLVISQVEVPLFERAMQHTSGNQTRAAALLGISRATLRKKLALYNLS